MKKIALFTALFGSSLAYAVEPTSSIHYVEMATQKHLAQETTWQRHRHPRAFHHTGIGTKYGNPCFQSGTGQTLCFDRKSHKLYRPPKSPTGGLGKTPNP